MFTLEHLKENLRYDPILGEFWWLKQNSRGGRKFHKQAGSTYGNGRRQISFEGITYPASVLAWFYMTEEWPEENVDHEDRNESNDKWNNLRLATKSQNTINHDLYSTNTSGSTGVIRKCDKWIAQITANGKRIYSGYFDYRQDAESARKELEIKYFGKFSVL